MPIDIQAVIFIAGIFHHRVKGAIKMINRVLSFAFT